MLDPALQQSLVGPAFTVAALAWMHGLRTYRQLPVAHSSSILWKAVLLSPAGDNYQVDKVFEYRGLIDSGRVTRRSIYL